MNELNRARKTLLVLKALFWAAITLMMGLIVALAAHKAGVPVLGVEGPTVLEAVHTQDRVTIAAVIGLSAMAIAYIPHGAARDYEIVSELRALPRHELVANLKLHREVSGKYLELVRETLTRQYTGWTLEYDDYGRPIDAAHNREDVRA